MPDSGNIYYCVKTDLSESGEIYLFADEVLSSDGCIIFKQYTGRINLAISKGNWKCFFPASILDGAPVRVEHWKGELVSQ